LETIPDTSLLILKSLIFCFAIYADIGITSNFYEDEDTPDNVLAYVLRRIMNKTTNL